MRLRYFRFILIGVAIGIVDLVPGVSGGTIAYAFGVWERIVRSISQAISGIISIRHIDFSQTRIEFSKVEWGLVLPIGIGVLIALILGAELIGSASDNYPSELRAVFLGLVIGCLPITLRNIDIRSIRNVPFLLIGIAAAWFFASAQNQELQESSMIMIFLVSAVAICATILPGLSGSFVLMVLGYYSIFIDAIRDRDYLIWVTFAAGAWSGTFIFTSTLNWLLNRYRGQIMSLLLGLMLGGLRVLWPWISLDRQLLGWPDSASLFYVSVAIMFGFSIGRICDRFFGNTKALVE